MTQKTNLNISPYYDDFDSEKNFYKVLFKPGYPVQARELTSLQSILQGQVESFGGHMFKEGSVIIPGNLTYDGQFYAVKLNSSNLGVDISLYINNFCHISPLRVMHKFHIYRKSLFEQYPMSILIFHIKLLYIFHEDTRLLW